MSNNPSEAVWISLNEEPQQPGETMTDFIVRLCRKGSAMVDSKWTKLPADVKSWLNETTYVLGGRGVSE